MSQSLVTSFCCSWVYVVALLVFVSSFGVSPASAQRSLECQKVWTEPSKDNDIIDCVTSTERIKSQWKYYVFAGVIVVYLVVLLFILPFICCGCFCSCCRCCCTCCSKTPVRRSDVCKAILLGTAVVIGAVCVAIFFFTGGALLRNHTSGTLNAIESGPLEYFDDTKSNIEMYLTNYNDDPPTPPDIDLSEFDTVHDDVVDAIDSSRKYATKYSNWCLVGFCIAAFLLLLMTVLALVGALCECDRCACQFGWVYYILAVLFCILALVFSLATYGLDAVCGEVVLQYRREPGIMQWYVVPTLSNEFDFDSIRTNVDEEVVTASQEACTELLKYCDPLGGADATKAFYCGNGLTTATDCQTINDAVTAVGETYMKPALVSAACPAPTTTSAAWKCTLAECTTACTEEELKNAAVDVMGQTDYAINASTALSLVTPILETNYILDVVLSVLLAKKTSRYASYYHKKEDRCADVSLSATMVAVAFFAGSLLLLLALLVILWVRRIYDEEHGSVKIRWPPESLMAESFSERSYEISGKSANEKNYEVNSSEEAKSAEVLSEECGAAPEEWDETLFTAVAPFVLPSNEVRLNSVKNRHHYDHYWRRPPPAGVMRYSLEGAVRRMELEQAQRQSADDSVLLFQPLLCPIDETEESVSRDYWKTRKAPWDASNRVSSADPGGVNEDIAERQNPLQSRLLQK